MKSTPPRRARLRRAFTIALVLWAIAFSAIIVVTMQVNSGRAAAAGRQSLARIRAFWAARAGVEAVIARLQSETAQDQPLGAAELLDAISQNARGALANSAYQVLRNGSSGAEPGVQDAHAKININTMTFDDLMLLPGMTEEVADAIIDWTTPLAEGEEAQVDDYASMPIPYFSRHGPIRHLAELELVTGVRPQDLRGLDLNLNGIIEPAELEAAGSPGKPAVATGSLADFGWSGYVTAASVEGLLAADGLERVDLYTAEPRDLLNLIDLTDQQASILIAWARNAETALGTPPTMEDYIQTSPAQMAQRLIAAGVQIAGVTAGPGLNQIRQLTNEQLKVLYDSAVADAGAVLPPGKVNLNTAPDELLEYVTALTATERDAILLYRSQNNNQIASIVDLLNIPQINRTRLAAIARLFTVQSTVFSITSQGTDATTGLQVEMTVEVERSSWPITVRSLTVR